MLSIKELSNEKDFESINKYIDSLYEDYQIKYLKKYSDNKLINAIINRYVSACKDKEIDFYCDIRDIDFSCISNNDITSYLIIFLKTLSRQHKMPITRKLSLQLSKRTQTIL